jgi:HSP20 family molecular chaperone IbpA
MTTQTQDIQARDKREVKLDSELTTPGRVYSPGVDIFEDDQALTIVADMPGVPSEHVTIDLRDDVLSLSGVPSVSVSEQEEYILREYDTGKFFRQFTLSEVIDQGSINANLSNGVLRVTLPKVEPAKPRRIEITEG